MPVLGLGTWLLTYETAATVAHALELGYRMIDTSGDYGTQPGIGEAVRKTRLPRSDLYLVTKVEETDEAWSAVRKNLRELGMDYADLVLIHRPPPEGVGENLWRGLMQARHDGFARDIGVSNYSIAQMQELADATGEMPAVNQIEWSPFGHSERMRRFCEEQRIVIQAYSPLTRGERLKDRSLLRIARRTGRTPAQLLLRWNLQLGTVPLPKANRLDHQKENLGALDFELSGEDMAALTALNERYSALGVLPYE